MPEFSHVVCPSCDGVNRVPKSKDAKSARCGKCHTQLLASHPLPLDERRFARHMSRSDVPVLVDFWASWCGPCRMMAPEFEKAAGAMEPDVRLVKVDTEASPGLAARYNIRSIPTLILFKAGREVSRLSGAMSARDLIAWTRSHL